MTSADAESVPESRTDSVPADGQSTETHSEPPSSPPDDLPLDEVFGLLKNQRRRRVLRILQEREEMITTGELAEEIAALENHKPVAHLHSDERKRVYVGLYQVHLPKMDALDAVDFNKARGTIERGRNTDELVAYLDRADDHEPGDDSPWYRYHLAVSGVVAVVFVVAMWVAAQSTLPIELVAGVSVVGAFSILAIATYLLG